MKKILPVFIISLAMFYSAKAQNGNNICVFNALDSYIHGGGPDDLIGGMKCSDSAAVNAATINASKTWFYRGMLYTKVALDTVLNKQFQTAGMEAIAAFKRFYAVDDKKPRDWWPDVYTHLYYIEKVVFNDGVEAYQAKNYIQAYTLFHSLMDVDSMLNVRGQLPAIREESIFMNSTKSAENAGKINVAIKVLKEWIAYKSDSIAYEKYAADLRQINDTVTYRAAVDSGLSKYPNDPVLLIDKINIFLDNHSPASALTFINRAMQQLPNNDELWFIKGYAYETIGPVDSSIDAYNKAIEINPKNATCLFNLGVHYVKKANVYGDQMNALGNSDADNQKAAELKGKRKELFLKAKTYFDRVKALEPDNAQNNRALKNIEMYIAE
ncbi:MAG TPA: tetratricopeptide repeat protein [Chitinophagales bacterium]|nr:tetratricopeptide repeat protein [Chitinophagales bacterium]